MLNSSEVRAGRRRDDQQIRACKTGSQVPGKRSKEVVVRECVISTAGHKKFYRESRARAHRLLTEGSRGAGEGFRRPEAQMRKLPWRPRERPAGKRAELRCREAQPKVGQGSADCARHRRKQSVGRSSSCVERNDLKHQRLTAP